MLKILADAGRPVETIVLRQQLQEILSNEFNTSTFYRDLMELGSTSYGFIRELKGGDQTRSQHRYEVSPDGLAELEKAKWMLNGGRG